MGIHNNIFITDVLIDFVRSRLCCT